MHPSFNGLGQLPSKQFIAVRICSGVQGQLMFLRGVKKHMYSSVAQRSMRLPVKQRGIGSNPVRGAFLLWGDVIGST